MSQNDRRKAPQRRAPKDSPYAGPATCLRCDREFWSWDRRQNRLCLMCRETIDREPSQESHPPFRPPTQPGRNRDEG
jgi:hypothetical protein